MSIILTWIKINPQFALFGHKFCLILFQLDEIIRTPLELQLRYVGFWYNSRWGHRAPGLAGALLTHESLTVGLIPDGIHVHPAVIEIIWASKGGNRLTLVSDAMAALGMSPGHYQIGDQAVVVTDTDARLVDGTVAGSILSPDAALRNLIAFTGCSLGEALPTITTTPARVLDLSDQRGQIAPGHIADLVLLTPDLQAVTTIVEGQVVYRGAAWQSNRIAR